MDCERALEATEGRLDEAATWLTQYAEPTATSSKKAAEKEKDKDGFKISGFEVKCLILKEHPLHVQKLLKVNFKYTSMFHVVDKGKQHLRVSN